jgi:hypothetical protein
VQFPLVTRKTHNKVLVELGDARLALVQTREEAASWRLEYRKIRDWVVDTAVNYAGSDPRIKGLFAQAATLFGGKV